MPRLIYTGDDPATQWIAGWPASDHDDEDEERVTAKVASGLYRRAVTAPRGGRQQPASDAGQEE